MAQPHEPDTQLVVSPPTSRPASALDKLAASIQQQRARQLKRLQAAVHQAALGKELRALADQREAAAAARQRELEQLRQQQAAANARRAAAAEERRRRKVEEAAREKEQRKQQLAARLALGAERADAVQQERHDVAKLQASRCSCCCRVGGLGLAAPPHCPLLSSSDPPQAPNLPACPHPRPPAPCFPVQRVRHAVAQQRRAEAVRERSLLEDAQRLDFMHCKQQRHAEQLERAAAEKAAAEVGGDAWDCCCHVLALLCSPAMPSHRS